MSATELFQTSWIRAWRGLDARGDGDALRDAVLARYAEPHRKYHTLQHLEECLALFESVGSAAERPAEVEMALWFHDAIYDLKSSDNEAKSAAWAHQALVAAGVAYSSAERIRDLIRVTRHTGVPVTQDEKVLVDIDLSILGASDARFAEYEGQIREEYSYVPGFIFRMKRKSILKSFLDRPVIYSTPAVQGQLEARARANLARAIGS
ncbi:HD domain-containing protein [Usitatibacter palustris]|uniref:N-methyl-D-aspartate receptor NMDAR2C subunit n=1 Tax=Usitatibacter palustris TaxID=2732487 RepID=A0A6M4H2N0_9PROT|nr:N-methyl-D-aspartate receptor NMDAR2C subunit [Usitatibacter palustris]QJR13328.1 hypothetical protein DSM104440_00111 [Usitatibacter palustris]